MYIYLYIYVGTYIVYSLIKESQQDVYEKMVKDLWYYARKQKKHIEQKKKKNKKMNIKLMCDKNSKC